MRIERKNGTPMPSLLAALLAIAPCAGTLAQTSDLEALLDGVSQIASPGVPGPLIVYGRDAFVVAAGGAGDGLHAAVVAAAPLGNGRIVAFGHGGFLSEEAARAGDTARLLQNCVKWAARKRGAEPPRIGVLGGNLEETLAAAGGTVSRLIPRELADKLDALDLLVTHGGDLSAEQNELIGKWIHRGGGLLIGGLGWGWLQLHSGSSLDENSGNRLLEEVGIRWADGYLKDTSEVGFAVMPAPPPLCHAADALGALVSAAEGKSEADADALAQAAWTTMLAARGLPADDKQLRPRMRSFARKHGRDIVPTESAPLTARKPLERFLLAYQLHEFETLPPERIPAHPAAKAFPGEPPRSASKTGRKMSIPLSRRGWHSTGLYASPGELITVVAGPAAADAGLSVRIGAHTDKLWDLDKWSRAPQITTQAPLVDGSTKASNAFGGLIYIDVPRAGSGEVEITIRGAIEAPLFVLGSTPPKQWRDEIRRHPAPWAELASEKVILTVPSEYVRTLEDPEELMRWWDRVADSAADLAAIPHERERPERYVADVQISAGYMHAGYPIMTHLDVAPAMVNLSQLGGGDSVWGFFHELGHNHQSSDWTFDGTGEVTCNLFTLYAMETVCGIPVAENERSNAEQIELRVLPYLANGAKFADWKKDPFLALQMYVQLQQAFGWDAFKRVFAQYRELPDDQRPSSDDEKRDKWMMMMSRAVGRNLGPFFEMWGVPTSKAARDQVATFPRWMPEGFPPK